MISLVGQSLGRYHILEQLGEGGMAVVYKAYDTRLDCDVAIKFIRMERLAPELAQKTLKRFEREAKSLARLSHPNIVKVTDYGEHEGVPYLVMPYLPGGTLKQRLGGRAMDWREAARLLLPVAEALDYAHSQGILHRDIKPSNILITQSGAPMLSDFGVAKLLEAEETLDLTATGVGVGTPEYMAPEQGRGAADPRSEVYSLGIVLYEMVTGRKPFTAETPLAVLLMQAADPLPSPRKLAPGLPVKVERVLIKALAKRPDDRYQSVRELVKALEELIAGTRLAAPPPPKTEKMKRAPRPALRIPRQAIVLIPIAVAAGLIIALASAWPSLMRRVSSMAEAPAAQAPSSETPSAFAAAAAVLTPTAVPPTASETPQSAADGGGDLYFLSDRRGKPNVYHYDPTGGEPLPVLPEDAGASGDQGYQSIDSYAWSPDRQKLLVYGWGEPIYVFSGNQLKLLSDFPEDRVSLSPWSPDSLLILLTSKQHSEHSSIVTINVDTGERWESFTGDSPSWSPDGKKFAFEIGGYSTSKQNPPQVVVYDLATAVKQVITYDGWWHQWSPDGNTMAYYKDDRTLQLSDIEGNYIAQVSGETDSRYSWSPLGDRITFQRGSGLFVTDIGSFNTQQLADFTVQGADSYYTDAVWARDGHSLAVTVQTWFKEQGGFVSSEKLFLLNLATRNLVDLGQGTQPAYSPDSKSLAFTSERDGNREIYVVNVDGTGLQNVSSDPGADSLPAWVE